MESIITIGDNFTVDYITNEFVVDGYKFNLPKYLSFNGISSIELSCDKKYAIIQYKCNRSDVLNLHTMRIIFQPTHMLKWNLEKTKLLLSLENTVKIFSLLNEDVKEEKSLTLDNSTAVYLCSERNILINTFDNIIEFYDMIDPDPYMCTTLHEFIDKLDLSKVFFACRVRDFNDTSGPLYVIKTIIFDYNLNRLYTIKSKFFWHGIERENMEKLSFTKEFDKISFYLPHTKLEKIIPNLYENELVDANIFFDIWEFLLRSEIVLE